MSANAFYYPVCPPDTVGDNGRYCHLPATINDNDTLGVSGLEPTSIATNGYYGDGDTIKFRVTFNARVTVNTNNGTPVFPVRDQRHHQTGNLRQRFGHPRTDLHL